MSTLQKCPVCKEQLPKTKYQPSAWGINGEACGDCKRARQRTWMSENRERSNSRYRRWSKKQAPHYEQKRQIEYKYGITNAEFDAMLARQYGRCLGCQKDITHKPFVDHDHATGKVRGLLCNTCNSGLGMTKDDPQVLRRLMVYLERDPTKKLVYVIGSLRNDKIREVAAKLREAGYDAFDEWHAAGKAGDDEWKNYSAARGHGYKEALEGRHAKNVFTYDRAYLDMADAAVMVMPAGKSGHLELGYFSGLGKPGYILFDSEPDRHDVMPRFAKRVFFSVQEMLVGLELDLNV